MTETLSNIVLQGDLISLGTIEMAGLLLIYFLIVFGIVIKIARKNEDTDEFIVANRQVGLGLGAGSTTATYIWAASFFSAAIAGYQYGIAGPIHYGLWGACALFFIWPYGLRMRELSPEGHTLPELIKARHGKYSHLTTVFANSFGSTVSLTVNLMAAGSLISMFSSISYEWGVIGIGAIILAYVIKSGFRSSVITDYVQITAMFIVAIVGIPMMVNSMGGVSAMYTGLDQNLSPAQASIFSRDALFGQGIPMFVAILSWAIGNQTLIQRVFGIKEDKIKYSFMTASVGYGAIVIGIGTLGFAAAAVGITPVQGDPNNLVPQLASTHLPFAFAIAFMLLILSALSSTADSDLSALSAIFMTDIWNQYVVPNNPAYRSYTLWIGRATMAFFTSIAIYIAMSQISILFAVMFMSVLWGCIVFPVISSLYWENVSDLGFTLGSVGGLVAGVLAAGSFVSFSTGPFQLIYTPLVVVGFGVVFALLAFTFLPVKPSAVVGFVAMVAILPAVPQIFAGGYALTVGATSAYGLSAIICGGIALGSDREYDFDQLKDDVEDLGAPPRETTEEQHPPETPATGSID
jgi:Na+/proline symporter